MNQTINSPFRYAGGKFYARKLILEHVPFHTTYIEPFAGGGSIFFAKPKATVLNWLNDIDEQLVNCYHIIKNRPQELINALVDEQATKQRHHFYKHEFQAKNELEQAVRWYYLNRTSYSGIMNMKNCYWGYGDKYSMRPENWGANILRTSQKLQGVRITNWDFEDVFRNFADKNVFMFIDPPYYNADQDKFYTHSFTLDDHVRLSNILKKCENKLKFLLTYDNCDEVRNLYHWASAIYDKEWNYTINRTDDQKKGVNNKRKGERYKGKEIFILNYQSDIQQQISMF